MGTRYCPPPNPPKLSLPSVEPSMDFQYNKMLHWPSIFYEYGSGLYYEALHSWDALVSNEVKLSKLEVSYRQFAFCDDIPLNVKCSSLSLLWA